MVSLDKASLSIVFEDIFGSNIELDELIDGALFSRWLKIINENIFSVKRGSH